MAFEETASKRRKPRVISHGAKERYLGELEQGAIKKEVAAKTFEPTELDSAYSGKMTKKKDGQKLNYKEGDIKNKHTSK